jgi:hypothetical protein
MRETRQHPGIGDTGAIPVVRKKRQNPSGFDGRNKEETI